MAQPLLAVAQDQHSTQRHPSYRQPHQATSTTFSLTFGGTPLSSSGPPDTLNNNTGLASEEIDRLSVSIDLKSRKQCLAVTFRKC